MFDHVVKVSSKLRVAYETDLQAMTPQSLMFPGLHPAAMMSTVGLGNQQQYRGSGFSVTSGPMGANSRPQNPPQIPTETCYLYIPNAAVGAIIGKQIVGIYFYSVTLFSDEF